MVQTLSHGTSSSVGCPVQRCLLFRPRQLLHNTKLEGAAPIPFWKFSPFLGNFAQQADSSNSQTLGEKFTSSGVLRSKTFACCTFQNCSISKIASLKAAWTDVYKTGCTSEESLKQFRIGLWLKRKSVFKTNFVMLQLTRLNVKIGHFSTWSGKLLAQVCASTAQRLAQQRWNLNQAYTL